MSKPTRPLLTLLLACALLLPLAGCGSQEEERPRIPKSRLKSSSQPLTPEERAEAEQRQKELVQDLMVWPEENGPPRDVHADHEECRARLEADRALATANPLVRMSWMTRCMAEKGWELNRELIDDSRG